jgi:hypothetical protein
MTPPPETNRISSPPRISFEDMIGEAYYEADRIERMQMALINNGDRRTRDAMQDFRRQIFLKIVRLLEFCRDDPVMLDRLRDKARQL